jgi:calcineurin-like phosphoesterase family protein
MECLPMTIWFSADLHLGHESIIRYTGRPFASVDLMDREIIARWNAAVGPKDDVWLLGDFCYGGAAAAAAYLGQLKGRVHLVAGNHDRPSIRKLGGWASTQDFKEILVGNQKISMMHYAMRTWPSSHHGALHLYGHSHGALPGNRQSTDVGVDVWDFRPVRLEEIKERLATLPERGGPRNPCSLHPSDR